MALHLALLMKLSKCLATNLYNSATSLYYSSEGWQYGDASHRSQPNATWQKVVPELVCKWLKWADRLVEDLAEHLARQEFFICSVLAFLKCTDRSVWTHLNCTCVLIWSHLRFSLNLPPLDFHSQVIPVYDNCYARKATKLPIWNRMEDIQQLLHFHRCFRLLFGVWLLSYVSFRTKKFKFYKIINI